VVIANGNGNGKRDAPDPGAWNIRRHARNIHEISISIRPNRPQWLLMMSDVHIDSSKCDRGLWRRHMNQAAERGAIVIDCGDFFDAMQGRYDRRSALTELDPELMARAAGGINYLDALVDYAATELEPYAENLAIMGLGNHETGITKNCETDLTERMVERLRAGGSRVSAGGYSGWVKMTAFLSSTQCQNMRIHYRRGGGGGGPVTRGVIQANRQAATIADADVIYNGHTHDSWMMEWPRLGLSGGYPPRHVEKPLTVIRGAGYKDDYGDGSQGWHVERWGPPKPRGAWWICFESVFRDGRQILDWSFHEAR
jgi:hypothetical protein